MTGWSLTSGTRIMARSVVLAVAALAAVIMCGSSAASKLPSTFKRCGVDDPDRDGCLRAAVQDAFQSIKSGIPSLGVLPTEPLHVSEINIDQGHTGPVSLAMHLSNISLTGLSKSVLLNYSSDVTGRSLVTTSLTPSMIMRFTHNVNGRVLLLPISGTGPGTFTAKDLYTDHDLKFSELKKKDGRIYWKMSGYTVKLRPKMVDMDFRGLFSNDPRLGEQMRNFISQNSRLVFEELRVPLEEAFGAIFREVTDRIFTKVPINDIFIFSTKDPKKSR